MARGWHASQDQSSPTAAIGAAIGIAGSLVLHYREPGGVLFEIATDPPGFAIDEPQEHLGERLMLPREYEPQRPMLERVLPSLTLPSARSKVTR